MISHKDAEEIQWATNTGVLGPDRLGIWPPYTDVTDVNAAMVSHDGHVIPWLHSRLSHLYMEAKFHDCLLYTSDAADE